MKSTTVSSSPSTLETATINNYKTMEDASEPEMAYISDESVPSIKKQANLAGSPRIIIDLTDDDEDLVTAGSSRNLPGQLTIKRESEEPTKEFVDLEITPASLGEESLIIPRKYDAPLTSEPVVGEDMPDYTHDHLSNLGIVDWQNDPEANAREAAELFALFGPGGSEVITHTEPCEEEQMYETPQQNAFDMELEDIAAQAAFHVLKKAFEKKQNEGPVSIAEEIDFQRASHAEQCRLALVKRAQDYRAPAPSQDLIVQEKCNNDLFFPEDEGLDPSSAAYPINQNRQVRKPRQKKANWIPAGELRDSQRIGYEGIAANKKTSRKSRAPQKTDKVKDSASRVSKAKEKPPEKTKHQMKKEIMQAAKLANLVDVKTLFSNNVIKHAQANHGKEGQTIFETKNRQEALKQLIASMPEGQQDIGLATKNQLNEACKTFSCRGAGSMHADGKGGWRLKGMTTSLYSYQLLGVDWMRRREVGKVRPFGGLVADSMGFGKTLLCIAVIVEAMPPLEVQNRTTLVVCPLSLSSQWMSELKKHTEEDILGEVMLYRSGSRIVTHDPVKSLKKCGVVVTTYNEVMRSNPWAQPPDHLCTEVEKQAWWVQYYEANKGPLHKIHWDRIILDEAHLVKNHLSRTSVAVRALNGKHRWALSGTPVANGIEEFYSLFAFLKAEHTGDYKTFRKNFCQRTTTTTDRLHYYLNSLMLRRTLEATMFNKPILTLPELDHQTIHVTFNSVEKAIYKIVKNRFVAKINKWIMGGNIEKRYRSMFTLLLRLRQLCSHVLLIQGTLKDLLEASDVQALWDLTKSEANTPKDQGGENILTVLRRMLDKQTEESTDAPADGTEAAPLQVEAMDNGSISGESYNFRKYLQVLASTGKWEEINERSTCCKCVMPLEQPYMTTPCNHLYCRECILAVEAAAKADNISPKCVACDALYTSAEKCTGLDEALQNIDNPIDTPALKAKTRGRKISSNSDGEGNDLNWINLPGGVLPSAKTRAVKSQLQTWFKEAPETKVLCFTQFLGMVRILGRICDYEGWGHSQYTGNMLPEARDKCLDEFKDNPTKRVLLVTLRSGSLGLNLTFCTKCLILDPWWNVTVEDQAFSRIYRIGQTSNVQVRRFCVNNSIDSDLLEMQAIKTADIDLAMGRSSSGRKITTEELLSLFGPIRHDQETGQPLVDSDEDDEFIFIQDESEDDRSDGNLPQTIPPRPVIEVS